MDNRKIIPFLMLTLVAFGSLPIFFQNVYAQSSATIQLFETGNASDDTCTSIAQTGSVTWLGCFATASSTLRINAMSGNSTIATTTLATQSAGGDLVFFPSGTDSIVFVDTAGASEIVRKYTLSGSTITNTASLTLTNCQAGANRPQLVGSNIFYLCDAGTEAGNIKVINPNTMVLQSTLTTLHQGNCTNAQAIQMNTGARGVVFCDNTEANLFTVSGTTITFSDELTGWASLTTGRAIVFTGQSSSSFTIWTFQYTAGSVIEVATVDIDTVTWSSGIVTVPSQSDVVGALPLFSYIYTIDATDDNVLVYDWSATQPSLALANLSGGGLDVTNGAGFGVGSDNASLLIASSVTDVGRYYIITDIVIAGTPVDGTPVIPGVTPPIEQTTTTLLCTVAGLQNLLGCISVDDDGDGDIDRWTVPGSLDANGIGAIMFLILLLISYALVVAVHSFARMPLREVNPMILLIVLVADAFIGQIFNLISDIIFYTIIAVMVGIAAFGLYRRITAGGG